MSGEFLLDNLNVSIPLPALFDLPIRGLIATRREPPTPNLPFSLL